jgi:hypothetical protein
VWHKAKSILKALGEYAKYAKYRDMREWMKSIANHFWRSCANCKGLQRKLADIWLGLLHHLTGSHDWIIGYCFHAPMTKPNKGKTWIRKDSPSMDVLRYYCCILIEDCLMES